MLPYQRPAIIAYSQLLAYSFHRWTGNSLLAGLDISAPDYSEALYYAPFILVSHGTEDDPIFRYVNQAAQLLWKSDFDTMTRMPSRLTAKPDAQEDRERLLKEAAAHGYVSNYRGTRVTTDGKLFIIRDTILWNVIDESGKRHGQAAMFQNFEWIER